MPAVVGDVHMPSATRADVMLRARDRGLTGYATCRVVRRCHATSPKENHNDLQTPLSRRLQRRGVERSIWHSAGCTSLWERVCAQERDDIHHRESRVPPLLVAAW